MDNQSRSRNRAISCVILGIISCLLLLVTYLDGSEVYAPIYRKYLVITIPAGIFSIIGLVLANTSMKIDPTSQLAVAGKIICWVGIVFAALLTFDVLSYYKFMYSILS